jgi:hypothetical protein
MTHGTRFVAVAVLAALALCAPVQAQTPEIDALRVRAEAGDAVDQWRPVSFRNGFDQLAVGSPPHPVIQRSAACCLRRRSGRAGDRCAEADAAQNKILQVVSLDLGGPRDRRVLRELDPPPPRRSACASASVSLLRFCGQFVVMTETPQFVFRVVDLNVY